MKVYLAILITMLFTSSVAHATGSMGSFGQISAGATEDGYYANTDITIMVFTLGAEHKNNDNITINTIYGGFSYLPCTIISNNNFGCYAHIGFNFDNIYFKPGVLIPIFKSNFAINVFYEEHSKSELDSFQIGLSYLF